jgi:hypothetical protein
MSKIVQFPGEFITEEDRERDRWVTVAFCATVVAGQPKDNQIEFLRATLAKFADVPDQRPPLDDRQYPAYAVKLLRPSLGAKFDRTAPVIRMFCAAVIRDLSFWARAAVIPD